VVFLAVRMLGTRAIIFASGDSINHPSPVPAPVPFPLAGSMTVSLAAGHCIWGSLATLSSLSSSGTCLLVGLSCVSPSSVSSSSPPCACASSSLPTSPGGGYGGSGGGGILRTHDPKAAAVTPHAAAARLFADVSAANVVRISVGKPRGGQGAATAHVSPRGQALNPAAAAMRITIFRASAAIATATVSVSVSIHIALPVDVKGTRGRANPFIELPLLGGGSGRGGDPCSARLIPLGKFGHVHRVEVQGVAVLQGDKHLTRRKRRAECGARGGAK